jgi:Cullin family
MLLLQVQSKIVVGLLAAVEAERQGLGVDREVMRRLLRMLVALGLYHDRFEVPFLADSRRFFLHEGQALATQSIPISSIHLLHPDSQGGIVKSEHSSSSSNSNNSHNYSTDSGASSSSSDQAFAAGYLLHVERRLLEAHDMVTRYLGSTITTP